MLAAMNSEIENTKLLLVEAQRVLNRARTRAAIDLARGVRDRVKKNLEELQASLKNVLG